MNLKAGKFKDLWFSSSASHQSKPNVSDDKIQLDKKSEAWHVYNSVFLIQSKICKNVDRFQPQIFMIIPSCCNDILLELESLEERPDTTLTRAGAEAHVTMLLTPPENLLTPVSGGQETQETATDSWQG